MKVVYEIIELYMRDVDLSLLRASTSWTQSTRRGLRIADLKALLSEKTKEF
jgi:hypothetical protein